VALTPRQAAFVREYVVDRHGTNAAIRAGYAKGSAEVAASRLLKVAKVKAAIEAKVAKLEQRLEEDAAVRAVDVLRELLRIGMSDPGQAFDENGALLPLHKMPLDIRRAISSVEVDQQTVDGVSVGTVAKVKFWPKDRGLEMLSKHLGLLRDRVELAGKDGEALSITIDLGAGK
jgi:phage terminase small subunit